MGGVISLETANTQKSEMFLLRISSGNVNASVVVTRQYSQFYLKNALRKTSFFVLFELLPTGLLNMRPFVTKQHE